MCELELEREWKTERIGDEDDWNELIRERIHEREEKEWKTSCELKPKLRTYRAMKQQLRTEPYLLTHHRSGIPELAKLREVVQTG